MTAYGRASGATAGKEYTVELRSVNNRFLDCTVRLPRAYSYLEDKVRTLIQQNGISRGKLEVGISINVLASEGVSVVLDEAYADSYMAALRQLRDRFSLSDDITVMQAAQNRDLFVIRKPEEDAEKEWEERTCCGSRSFALLWRWRAACRDLRMCCGSRPGNHRI